MISSREWIKRRQKLLKMVGPDALVLIPTAPLAPRNGDYQYPFRPNSDFYYLTGFDEPEAVAVLAPKRAEGEFLLFNRARHPDKEKWEGPRAGQKGACKLFGANQAFAIETFADKLVDLLNGRSEVYCLLNVNREFDEQLFAAMNTIRTRARAGVEYPDAIVDAGSLIHELRLIKSPAEIALMRKAATISADAHMRAMQTCKPGMMEYELEAEVQYEFNRQGARYVAYTSIVGAGANACTLHYTANNQKIKNGDLVLIDAGAEYQYYAADITRTFPANGKFSQEQAAIYNLVLEAQLAAIKIIKPDIYWEKMHEVAVKVITQGLVKLGLLKGRVDKLIAERAYLPFYMHRTGHWLGLDVHDVGQYMQNKKWRKLQAGMVLTVEPGIYISSDLKVPARWHNIGVRIEDDILVTAKGCDILSKRVPKTLADIEALVG